MDDKINYIRAKLPLHYGELNRIAFESNIGRRTLGNIMSGDHVPTIATINKLYKYLKKIEGK